MKAVILAGGSGSRLRPITNEIPKTLVPIHGTETILDFILNSFPSEIDEVFIIVSYFSKKIEDHIEKSESARGKKIRFLHQKIKDGTMGAINLIKPFVGEKEKFFVIHGDDYHKPDDIKQFIKNMDYGISLSKKVYNPNYYAFEIKDGYINKIRPQSEHEKKNGALIASGMYMLNAKIFSFPQKILFDKEIGLPQTILSQKEKYPLEAYIEEDWYPVNDIQDLEKLRSFLKQNMED